VGVCGGEPSEKAVNPLNYRVELVWIYQKICSSSYGYRDCQFPHVFKYADIHGTPLGLP
jgi:hypothetical protein